MRRLFICELDEEFSLKHNGLTRWVRNHVVCFNSGCGCSICSAVRGGDYEDYDLRFDRHCDEG